MYIPAWEWVLLSRIPVVPDSNLLLAPAIDTVNRLPILLYQSQFADTRILVTISNQHIRGALNVPLKGVRYVLRVADDIIGPTGDVMTLNGHYPYTEKVHSTKYHFTIIFNPPPLFSFYRLIDKGFGILIFILLIACAAAFLLDRYFNKSATPEEILRRAINNGRCPFLPTCGKWSGRDIAGS